jgi:hypothetical protein
MHDESRGFPLVRARSNPHMRSGGRDRSRAGGDPVSRLRTGTNPVDKATSPVSIQRGQPHVAPALRARVFVREGGILLAPRFFFILSSESRLALLAALTRAEDSASCLSGAYRRVVAAMLGKLIRRSKPPARGSGLLP